MFCKCFNISFFSNNKSETNENKDIKTKIKPLCKIKFKKVIVYGEPYYIIIGRCYPKCKLRHKLNFNEKLLWD